MTCRPERGPFNGTDDLAFGFLADLGTLADSRMWVDQETTSVHPHLRKTNLVFHQYAHQNDLGGRIGTQFSRSRHVLALRWYFTLLGRPRLFVAGYAEMRYHLTANAEILFRKNGVTILEQLRDKMRHQGLEAF